MSRNFTVVGPIEATASKFGNGAHVCVPKEWVGRRVRVVPCDDQEANE